MATADTNSSRYTIPNVQLADNDTRYHVVVSNDYGHATSTVATLYTGYAPVITQDLEDAFAQAGDRVEFNIIVTGTAPLTYHWYKDSSLTPLDANESSLLIENAGADDFGIYYVKVSTCSVRRKV